MQKVSATKVRTFLRHELSMIQERNPQFSLRSFAKMLGVSHSVLSRILSGKRQPSRSFVERLVQRRGVSLTSLLTSAKEPTTTAVRHNISQEDFAQVATWEHYAVKGLLEQYAEGLDRDTIAKKVGLRVDIVGRLLSDLISISLVTEDSADRFMSTRRHISVMQRASFSAARDFNRGLLYRAEKVMDEVDFAYRNLTSMVMNVALTDLPEAFRTIMDFRRNFCQKFEKTQPGAEVYSLQIQMIPLTLLDPKQPGITTSITQ